MKACVYEGIEKFVIKDVEKPLLPAGGMIIKVKSCAICGTDLKIYKFGNPNVIPPRILGHEFVGEIIEMDKDVKNFKIGDRVTMATSVSCGTCILCLKGLGNLCGNKFAVGTMADGAFAEFMSITSHAIKQGNVFKVPDEISDDEGTLSEPLGCVVNAQLIAGVNLGDTVVVIGGGPLGCLHLEVAKINGASKLILIEQSAIRLSLVKDFVDCGICSSNEDPVERVMKITEGIGADVVIVAAPSIAAHELGFKIISKGGRISFFGSLPKDKSIMNFDTRTVHYNQLKVCGASDSAPFHHRIGMELLKSGEMNVKSIITHKFPLNDIMIGFNTLFEGKALKVVINPEKR